MNRNIIIAFLLVIAASVAGAVLSGNQAGRSGAKAAQTEVQRVASQYAYSINVSLVTSQRAGCARNNKRTAESNRRVGLHNRQDAAIRAVAEGARRARLASYAKTKQASDLTAAREYLQAIRMIDSIKFRRSPMVNCKLSYPLPEKP